MSDSGARVPIPMGSKRPGALRIPFPSQPIGDPKPELPAAAEYSVCLGHRLCHQF